MSSPPTPSGFPSTSWGNLSSKGIDIVNTAYPISDERTRVQELPFPHPKYHIVPSTGDIYESASPIFEEYDPVTGYVDSVLPVMASIEVDEIGEQSRMNEDRQRLRNEKGVGKRRLTEDQRRDSWTGRVEHPESSERTSIQREAKRIKEMREDSGEVRRNK